MLTPHRPYHKKMFLLTGVREPNCCLALMAFEALLPSNQISEVTDIVFFFHVMRFSPKIAFQLIKKVTARAEVKRLLACKKALCTLLIIFLEDSVQGRTIVQRVVVRLVERH